MMVLLTQNLHFVLMERGSIWVGISMLKSFKEGVYRSDPYTAEDLKGSISFPRMLLCKYKHLWSCRECVLNSGAHFQHLLFIFLLLICMHRLFKVLWPHLRRFEFYITFNTNVWLCSGDLHTVLHITSWEVLKVTSSSLQACFTAMLNGVPDMSQLSGLAHSVCCS
jgi:hypothetical protein